MLMVADNIVKLSQLISKDVYQFPNLFKNIEKNADVIGEKDWISLLEHPYTPTCVKCNLTPFLCAVKAILKSLSNGRVTEYTLQFTFNRLLYDKNKKKVYLAVTEHLLPLVIDNYTTSASAAAIITDILLTKENVGLLEASLLANMQNFTKSLLSALSTIDIHRAGAFYQIICDKIYSKNKNKFMLKLYLAIQNMEVDRNTQLLDIIIKQRLFQIKEDNEQDNIISKHLTGLLDTLQEDEWCTIATRVLQLNYNIVSLDTACCYSNDTLLARLFITYHKLSKFLDLFTILLDHSFKNCEMCLGDRSRLMLIETSTKLTELQVTDLTKLFVHVLTDKISGEDELNNKKIKLDSKLFTFATECCGIILSNHKHDLTKDDVFLRELTKLYNILDKIPAPASDFINLYFTKCVVAETLPIHFTCNIDKKHIESAEQLEGYIKNLVYSENIADDIDVLFSYLPQFPDTIIPNMGVFYDNLLTDHLVLLAHHILSTQNTHVIHNQTFGRLKDLHSVIVMCILKEINLPYLESKDIDDPLVDMSMSSAREIIKQELDTKPFDHDITDYHLKIISQLSLDSCYLRLLVTTWILCRRSSSHFPMLIRFCKPPPPLSSLPIIHGTHAGRVLVEILPYLGNNILFLETYLKSCVLLNSVEITALISGLCIDPIKHSNMVRSLVKVVTEKPGCVQRYQTCLEQLNTALITVLDNRGEEESVCESVCHLLCASCNVNSLLSDGQNLRYLSLLPNVLSSMDCGLELKLELAQTFVNHIVCDTDSNKIITICDLVLDLLERQNSVPDIITFSSTNKVFINNLYKNLPRKSAEMLLNQIDFSCDVIENIKSVPEIPLSLLPKLISHLDKKQVLVSLRDKADVTQLSKCLLCMVQNSYPIHLLNSVFVSIFSNMSTTSYTSNPSVVANIARSCEVIAKQKEVVRHHAPYILSTIFEYISKGNSVLVSDVTPAIYSLFSVCLVQGFQFLQARLNPGAKELFIQLQSHYKNNVKYQGKV